VNSSDLLFRNPPLESLETAHAHFAMRNGLAVKFPRQVTPFAAVLENSAMAMADLRSLLEPGELVFVVSFERLTQVDGLKIGGPFGVRQMEWPAEAALPEPATDAELKRLSGADAEEMVELTSIAFPGFFRIRTCEMGTYYGVRDGVVNAAGERPRLMAMCGERMAIRDFKEISGLCTLPDYRGRGYAAALITRLLHDHRAEGARSYLHVSSDNATAIALYRRMGFRSCGEFPTYRVTRLEE
jgi:GNAT superfamily N-acetyltransferase